MVSPVAQGREIPASSRQCLVVISDSWSATGGQMAAFERAKGSGWQPHGAAVPVVLGKTGLGWGRGPFDRGSLPGPAKKEGDNRAPAGVFPLRSAFGYARENPGTRMPYLALNSNIVAVDDQRSRYYNELVDKSKIVHPDWHSAENMILRDDRYKWGVVVAHNQPPKPGAGSCIFLHVWKSPITLTTGCTATAETHLLSIIRWLDPAKRPVLVQIPAHIYSEVRETWGLPKL